MAHHILGFLGAPATFCGGELRPSDFGNFQSQFCMSFSSTGYTQCSFNFNLVPCGRLRGAVPYVELQLISHVLDHKGPEGLQLHACNVGSLNLRLETCLNPLLVQVHEPIQALLPDSRLAILLLAAWRNSRVQNRLSEAEILKRAAKSLKKQR